MTSKRFENLSLDFGATNLHQKQAGDATASITGVQLRVTPVFHAYWRFAAERQRIFFRRLNNIREKLTNDPVLMAFKFTNAYRASDRVSKFLIRHVIYREDLPTDERNIFFGSFCSNCSIK